MKQKRNLLWVLPLAVVVLILATLVFYHKAVRLVFYNLTVPTYELDETRDWSGGTTYMEVPYSDVSPSDYVNIYVPDSGEAPPLYVVIHGGGFVSNDAESRQAQWMYRYGVSWKMGRYSSFKPKHPDDRRISKEENTLSTRFHTNATGISGTTALPVRQSITGWLGKPLSLPLSRTARQPSAFCGSTRRSTVITPTALRCLGSLRGVTSLSCAQ